MAGLISALVLGGGAMEPQPILSFANRLNGSVGTGVPEPDGSWIAAWTLIVPAVVQTATNDALPAASVVRNTTSLEPSGPVRVKRTWRPTIGLPAPFFTVTVSVVEEPTGRRPSGVEAMLMLVEVPPARNGGAVRSPAEAWNVLLQSLSAKYCVPPTGLVNWSK